MRILGYILIASLVLGCSHSPTNEPNPSSANNDVIYLKKGDREPANAPQLLWQPAAVRVEVTSASVKVNASVEVNQEMIWKEMENFPDFRNEYRETEVVGQCSDFVCPVGSSKSALWDALYAAPREKKAAALANAIQGIGDTSAEALVTRKYFTSKPKTWNEFSAEISRAANAGVIKKSVASSVLNNYKYENIANLGYARGACREEIRSCTMVISKLVKVPFTNQRDVERRRIVSTKNFSVNVSVMDAVLLATEKDTLTLRIDENGRLVNIDTNGYNRYAVASQEVDGQNVSLQIKSESRVLRDLSSNVVRQDSYQLIGEKATFMLDVDPAFIPGTEDPNAQLVVDYTVRACKYGWTGLCGFGWDKLIMSSAPITSARSVLPVQVPRQHKSEIVYSISRKNSRFFNDKGTSERSTDSIKMPK